MQVNCVGNPYIIAGLFPIHLASIRFGKWALAPLLNVVIIMCYQFRGMCMNFILPGLAHCLLMYPRKAQSGTPKSGATESVLE
jgi:hypothetical protein